MFVPWAACTEPVRKPAPVTVSIDGDRAVRAETVQIEVEIEAEVGTSASGGIETWMTLEQLKRKLGSSDDAYWPWQFKLDPEDDSYAHYSLKATARDGQGAVVARAQAIRGLEYVRRKGLRVHFDAECFRLAELCKDGTTCAAGACVDATTTGITASEEDEDGDTPSSGEPKTGGAEPTTDGTGRVGEACMDGSRACLGHASRTPLLCEGGAWRAQADCADMERCDTGKQLGMCLPIAAECMNREPSATFCDGETMRACTDLVAAVVRPCAEFEQCVPDGANARCACRLGYVLDASSGQCVRADDCGSANGGCDPSTQCSMESGARTCSGCPSGYTGTGEEGCHPLLAELGLSAGRLEPELEMSTRAYEVHLPLLAQRIELAPVVPANTSVTIDGSPLPASGKWTSAVLPLGRTSISLVLKSAAGVDTEYALSVERAGSQEAYIKSSNAEAGDQFGFWVDLSGDTMVTTAWFEDSSSMGVAEPNDNNSAADSGAAYVFVREADGWKQQAYLKPNDTRSYSYFGVRAAIEGDTIVVGALNESIFQPSGTAARAGAAYVYTRKDGAWVQSQRLAANDPDGADLFGAGIALEGDTLAIGAPWESSVENDSGAVYVYERSGGMWVEKQVLKSMDPGAGASFGSVVAISGDRMVVGSPNDARPAKLTGSADVFVRRDGMWKPQQFLKPVDLEDGASFGFMVAVNRDRIVVGAPRTSPSFSPAPVSPGEVHVFDLDGEQWKRTAVLRAPVPHETDCFGIDVALTDTLLAVGASGDSSGARGLNGDPARTDARLSGAAYLFAPTSEGWVQSAYIKPHNTNASDAFGYALAVDGETLAITSTLESAGGKGVGASGAVNAARNSGSVYVFR